MEMNEGAIEKLTSDGMKQALWHGLIGNPKASEQYVEEVYKEGAAKRRQEEMQKAEEMLQKAKQDRTDRLLDSLIETNSYLIKLHEDNHFNAQRLMELMQINAENHAKILKEIR